MTMITVALACHRYRRISRAARGHQARDYRRRRRDCTTWARSAPRPRRTSPRRLTRRYLERVRDHRSCCHHHTTLPRPFLHQPGLRRPRYRKTAAGTDRPLRPCPSQPSSRSRRILRVPLHRLCHHLRPAPQDNLPHHRRRLLHQTGTSRLRRLPPPPSHRPHPRSSLHQEQAPQRRSRFRLPSQQQDQHLQQQPRRRRILHNSRPCRCPRRYSAADGARAEAVQVRGERARLRGPRDDAAPAARGARHLRRARDDCDQVETDGSHTCPNVGWTGSRN